MTTITAFANSSSTRLSPRQDLAPAATTALAATPAQPQALAETRVEALFASTLQRSDEVTPETVRDAITSTVRRYGCQGCAAVVAQEFGEHPETAVRRMRWALTAVREAYALG